MTDNEKNLVCNKIGEYFLRVVKNHNYYLVFRRVFLNSIGLSTNRIKMTPINKELAYMSEIYRFARHADKEYAEHRHEDSDYEYITIFINLLLRKYLEGGGVDPRKLGMVGQELFDLTCYGIYGDKYIEDMENMNRQKGGMRAPRNDKEAWLMAEFEERLRRGERLDFETFMRERTNVSDEEFWRNANDNQEYFEERDDQDEDDDIEYFDEDVSPWD